MAACEGKGSESGMLPTRWFFSYRCSQPTAQYVTFVAPVFVGPTVVAWARRVRGFVATGRSVPTCGFGALVRCNEGRIASPSM